MTRKNNQVSKMAQAQSGNENNRRKSMRANDGCYIIVADSGKKLETLRVQEYNASVIGRMWKAHVVINGATGALVTMSHRVLPNHLYDKVAIVRQNIRNHYAEMIKR